MSKRIAIGLIGGTWDARIARPGYSATDDDVNDRHKISFAASRPTRGKVIEAGTITATDAWVPLAGTYAGIPNVELWLNRGGQQVYGAMDRIAWTQNPGVNPTYYYRDGSTYVLVVTLTQILVTRPYEAGYPASLVGGDTFNYLVVGN